MGSQPAGRTEQAGGQAWILYGIISSIVVGTLLGGLAPQIGVRLELLGELFMNALKMIVVPLIVVSMVCGVAALGDVRKLGKLGTRTVGYYMVTTSLSVVVGIALVNVIRPGAGVPTEDTFPQAAYTIEGTTIRVSDVALPPRTYAGRYRVELTDQDIQGEVVEQNHGVPGELTVDGWFTLSGDEAAPEPSGRGVTLEVQVTRKTMASRKSAGEAVADLLRKMVPSNIIQAAAETDVLPLIFFSLLFGAALTTLGAQAKPALDFFGAANAAIMRLVHLILYTAPFGILGLVAARIGHAGGFVGFAPELKALAAYFGTVVAGLAIHGLIILPLIVRLVARRRVLEYARNVAPALLNAFSTASSSATLPITLECSEDRNKISARTAGFVLPLGATINMDGTALYEAVAALFVAQAFGIEMTAFHTVIIFLTATLASIGAAGIPEAGLVTMVIVLTAVNLPLEGITLILTIDWLLDRFRTTVNVWGDCVGAATIEALASGDA